MPQGDFFGETAEKSTAKASARSDLRAELRAEQVAELVAAVDRLRAAGAPVAQACRETGLSPSSYYRARNKRAGGAPDAAALQPEDLAPLAPKPLIGHSPWAAADEARGAPLGAGAYWKRAFSTELSDSAIFSHLFGARRAPAPQMLTGPRLAPRWRNRLGRIGLGWLGQGVAAALSLWRTLLR